MKDYNYHIELSENSSLGLNIIRIIAIQMVVIGHGISFMGIFPYLSQPYFPYLQNIGVVLFFLISGFLITYTTLRKMNKRRYSFMNYLIERGSRIYSVYLPVLVLLIGLDAFLFIYLGVPSVPNSYNIANFFHNLLMLQDSFPILVDSTSFGSARPLWTLPMFWGIYMVFGWLILGNRTTSKKFLYIFILAMFSFFLVLTSFGFRTSEKLKIIIIWLSGCMVAIILNISGNNANERTITKDDNSLFNKIYRKIQLILNWFSQKLLLSFLLFVLVFCLACYRVLYTKFSYDLPFGILLALALYFFVSFTNRSNHEFSVRTKKIIKFFASYSFTLYLLHYSILWIISAVKYDVSPYFLFFTGFLLSNFLSIIVAYFTEMRYNRIKKYILSRFSKIKVSTAKTLEN